LPQDRRRRDIFGRRRDLGLGDRLGYRLLDSLRRLNRLRQHRHPRIAQRGRALLEHGTIVERDPDPVVAEGVAHLAAHGLAVAGLHHDTLPDRR
jgi:hypothetical protein